MRVLLRVRDPQTKRWDPNATRELNFQRLPMVGEHFTLVEEGDWYEVRTVVHTPFADDLAGELYAVVVDDEDVIRRTCMDPQSSEQA